MRSCETGLKKKNRSTLNCLWHIFIAEIKTFNILFSVGPYVSCLYTVCNNNLLRACQMDVEYSRYICDEIRDTFLIANEYYYFIMHCL